MCAKRFVGGRAILGPLTGFLSLTMALLAADPTRGSVIAGPITNPANGNNYYLLEIASWQSAETEAVSLGGHLATVNNAAEQAWIFSTFANYGGTSRNLWIGFTDQASEGTWVWISGEPVTYTNWQPPQPDDEGGGGGDWAHMFSPTSGHTTTGGWNDAPLGGWQPSNGVVEVAADVDSDGVSDGSDNCPNAPNPGQADADSDGFGDACDGCPSDPAKTAPGDCGCGVADGDDDGDGVPNCNDLCPGFDDAVDCNNNSVPDGCDVTGGGASEDCTSNSVPDECEVSQWSGPDGGSFSDSANWQPADYPYVTAFVRNTGPDDNRCLSQSSGPPICRLTIEATGSGRQIFMIDQDSGLEATLRTDVGPGGELRLRDGLLTSALVTNAANTIRGYGRIEGQVDNAGLIEAEPAQTLTLRGDSLTNQPTGMMRSLIGGALAVQAPSTAHQGSIELRPQSVMTFESDLTNPAGAEITLWGGAVGADGLTNELGGIIQGTGMIDADTINRGNMIIIADMLIVGDLHNDGTIAIQSGTLTITGNLSGTGVVIGGFGG